nr:hypothetical protein Iba_chr06aCG16400 [Ipomoea batatas]GMD08187.1 hypothetical protein Iba_chr06cCG14320 [Ipomoea batatas]
MRSSSSNTSTFLAASPRDFLFLSSAALTLSLSIFLITSCGDWPTMPSLCSRARPWNLSFSSALSLVSILPGFRSRSSSPWLSRLDFDRFCSSPPICKAPTLQLSWGDIKLLPPNLLTIRWELYFEKLGSKENGTCCNVMGLKLQA